MRLSCVDGNNEVFELLGSFNAKTGCLITHRKTAEGYEPVLLRSGGKENDLEAVKIMDDYISEMTGKKIKNSVLGRKICWTFETFKKKSQNEIRNYKSAGWGHVLSIVLWPLCSIGCFFMILVPVGLITLQKKG